MAARQSRRPQATAPTLLTARSLADIALVLPLWRAFEVDHDDDYGTTLASRILDRAHAWCDGSRTTEDLQIADQLTIFVYETVPDVDYSLLSECMITGEQAAAHLLTAASESADQDAYTPCGFDAGAQEMSEELIAEGNPTLAALVAEIPVLNAGVVERLWQRSGVEALQAILDDSAAAGDFLLHLARECPTSDLGLQGR